MSIDQCQRTVNSLDKEIARLEKLARTEKQPKKKFEIVQKINTLKGELMSFEKI